MFALATMLMSMIVTAWKRPTENQGENQGPQDDALLNLTGLFTTVGIVRTVVVTFLVLGNLIGTYADSIAVINENLTDPLVTFGDPTTDSIKPVFAIVVGIAALIGFVGLLLSPFGRGGS